MNITKSIFHIGLAIAYTFFPAWAAEEENKVKEQCSVQEEFSETKHQVMIDGNLLEYRAVAGTLLLKDEKCQPKASIFYISYTKEEGRGTPDRPITFCFNGGPGSSSVWLHLGILGPKRVFLLENGDGVPPFHLVDNEFSLLDITDLVFIDPVSTGFSRAIPPEEAKNYHGVEEDVKSIADFIRLYLTRYDRWTSPKFLVGESYGTTRAAGLAEYLHDEKFLYLNGIALISSVLNFQSIDFNSGNDLPYLLFLPSYTAAAWYHKKLSPELLTNFDKTMDAAKAFVTDEYAKALFKGDLLQKKEREKVTEKLSYFTGLSPEYIERSQLRVDIFHFVKELLRDQSRTVGRFDSRFKGIDANSVGEHFEYDPSADAVFGAFTATMNQYLKTDLKWTLEAPYKILSSLQPWDYGSSNKYLNVAESLRGVMTKNPYLRVFVGSGYYDLATPYFATEYTFSHLGLDQALKDHVMMRTYDAGHMMYIYAPVLAKMKGDLREFYEQTLRNQQKEEQSGESIQR